MGNSTSVNPWAYKAGVGGREVVATLKVFLIFSLDDKTFST